ncbi:unnamed protein product [Urochloa decumbens]|uniref:PDZ domain-containing protein n=1 Tax=Urochloa decumbens TaxID=240449 RepID=A0ABC9AQ07_9POAL
MPLPTAEEGSGSRSSRSSARRRRRRSESLEQRRRYMTGEMVWMVKKIRTCEEAAQPSDAEIARKEEVDQATDELEATSSALCAPHIRQEVVGHDSNAVEVYSETFRNEAEEDVVSSAPSSPLCEPRIQQEVIGHDSNGVEICKAIDIETFRAYRQFEAKFDEKLARKMKLPTLDGCISSSPADAELHHGRQYATKAARSFVLALSSSIGGKPLKQCSGFFIGWDESDKNHETGLILTSAHLICSKQPSLDSWLCEDEYAPDAEVIVHFPDRTTSKGKLCYYQKHYNIALFSTKVKPSLQLPVFNDNVNCGQKNPCTFERHHFMYTYGAAPECGIGGPIVDFSEAILGMSTPDSEGSFVPSSILLKCFHLWRKHGRIPRPHLQLKLSAIQYLDEAHIERISLDCGIDDGLIVKEVSNGSMAEKNGIRVGDVVESLDGNCITSLVELEIMLLDLSQQHLERGSNSDSKIDVELGIFRTRRRKRRTIKMTLKLTEEGEEVVRGYYTVTAPKAISSWVPPEKVDQGQIDIRANSA